MRGHRATHRTETGREDRATHMTGSYSIQGHTGQGHTGQGHAHEMDTQDRVIHDGHT